MVFSVSTPDIFARSGPDTISNFWKSISADLATLRHISNTNSEICRKDYMSKPKNILAERRALNFAFRINSLVQSPVINKQNAFIF